VWISRSGRNLITKALEYTSRAVTNGGTKMVSPKPLRGGMGGTNADFIVEWGGR